MLSIRNTRCSMMLRTCWCRQYFLHHRVATRWSRSARMTVRAVGWDPEGILGSPTGGHIQRRSMQKQLEQNRALDADMEHERLKARQELWRKRESRQLPSSQQQLIEFLLETESAEMQFEVARCRGLLTPDFFAFLQREITQERLSSNPRYERVDELTLLQQYLEEAVTSLDKAAVKLTAPADRLRKLLAAPDKKAMLYEMAGNNEIDQALVDLLQQNIEAAGAAGQKDAVEFMTRVKNAARKFVIKA